MGISAANIIVQGEHIVKQQSDTPTRSMDEIRSMASQQNVKRKRVVEEPLIEHRESAFHADMLYSHKHK